MPMIARAAIFGSETASSRRLTPSPMTSSNRRRIGPRRARTRELGRGQRAPLAQVYADGVEVSGDRHHVDAHHVAQALGRGRVARGDRLELDDRATQRALEEAREQLLL